MNIFGGFVLGYIKKRYIIFILLILSGCRIAHLDSLTPNRRTPITIRTDGYFYNLLINPQHIDPAGISVPEKSKVQPIFFYQDNSCLYGGNFSSHESLEEYVTADKFKEAIRDIQGWGYFYIEGDVVTIQFTDLDATGIEVRKLTGRVVNDSTLQFGSTTCKFRHSPKPDSSNWVKDRLAKRHHK